MTSNEDSGEAWASQGEDFRVILGHIDRAWSQLLGERRFEAERLEIIPLRWDMPDWTVVFRAESSPVRRSVQCLIEGRTDEYEIRVTAAAWFDESMERSFTRYWCHSAGEIERDWRIPVGVARSGLDVELGRIDSQLVDRIKTSLGNAAAVSESWKFDVDARKWSGPAMISEAPADLSASLH